MSYNSLTNLLAVFRPTTFFSSRRAQFTCSGEIEAIYLAGIPRGDEGNTLTFHQWRRRQGRLLIVSGAALTVSSLNDIETTETPNLYRIVPPASLFTLEVGDSLSVAFSNLPQNSGRIFELSFINSESPMVLHNIEILIGREGGAIADFPLLSLRIR